jgi:hypothetical protein
MEYKIPLSVRQAIINDYTSGISPKEICIKYSTNRTCIARLLKEFKVCNNLVLKKQFDFKIPIFEEEKELEIAQNVKGAICNHSYFEKINTEHKAYWLGFFAADGYVKKDNKTLRLKLAEKDVDHIYMFALDIRCPNSICREENQGFPAYSIKFKSAKMVEDLKSHHITYDKTNTLEWPEKVPFELERHFMRGYMDGDGSWYYSKFLRSDIKKESYREKYGMNLVSTVKFLEVFRDKLVDYLNISSPKLIFPYENTLIGKLSWNGNINLERIARYLYVDASIFLERKFEHPKKFLKGGERTHFLDIY